jgi:hypothetical protein
MKRLIISLLFMTSSLGFAQDMLSPHGYLRKLSLSIKGLDPSLTEHQALDQAIMNHAENAFFSNKISEYLGTQNHVEKMNYRLDELFFLKSAASPEDLNPPLDNFTTDYTRANSLNALFRTLVQKNMSWDTLLTGKDYTVYYQEGSKYETYKDLGFYAALKSLPLTTRGVVTEAAPNGSDNPLDWRIKTLDIKFDDNDPRIAGAITTERFFERYTNTALNKDRRRSAAIFRIFLCNPMMPIVIPPDSKKTQSLLDMARGNIISEASHSLPSQAEARHGSDINCTKCHAMLDPMGRTFQASSIAVGPDPASGSLYYKRFSSSGTTEVNIPVSGLGELGKVISEQPEYSQCQVKHFWKWFIGDDVDLSDARLNTLVQKFDELGHKPNDFVAYLVNQDEFKQRRYPQPLNGAINFSTVKATFKQCAACHTQAEAPVADLTKIPFENSSGKMDYWIDRISKRLDLEHNGKSATMPPAYSQWRPSAAEIANLKGWIKAGAPDEKGVAKLVNQK